PEDYKHIAYRLLVMRPPESGFCRFAIGLVFDVSDDSHYVKPVFFRRIITSGKSLAYCVFAWPIPIRHSLVDYEDVLLGHIINVVKKSSADQRNSQSLE